MPCSLASVWYSARDPRHVAQGKEPFCQRIVCSGSILAAKKIGSKRARTTNTKYFKEPFHADIYIQHLANQHAERWKQYQDTDDAGKNAFFREQLPIKRTLQNYIDTKQIKKIFLINASIVDLIIGKILWDPEETESQTHAKMMV